MIEGQEKGSGGKGGEKGKREERGMRKTERRQKAAKKDETEQERAAGKDNVGRTDMDTDPEDMICGKIYKDRVMDGGVDRRERHFDGIIGKQRGQWKQLERLQQKSTSTEIHVDIQRQNRARQG